jgi:hypothetical protein
MIFVVKELIWSANETGPKPTADRASSRAGIVQLPGLRPNILLLTSARYKRVTRSSKALRCAGFDNGSDCSPTHLRVHRRTV